MVKLHYVFKRRYFKKLCYENTFLMQMSKLKIGETGIEVHPSVRLCGET